MSIMKEDHQPLHFFNEIIQFSYPVFILSPISLSFFSLFSTSLHPVESQSCSSVVPLSLLGSCAGLLETGSRLGERQVSLGNLYSHSVRAGSGEGNLWLKEDLFSIPFHFAHLHTHAWKGWWESRNKHNSPLSQNWLASEITAHSRKTQSLFGCIFPYSGSDFYFLSFFFSSISFPRSLPSGWMFLLPQWEYDGIPLPMPTVSQLPALSGLLLEGTRWRFP